MLRRLSVLGMVLLFSLSLLSSPVHASEKITVTVGEWPPFLSQKIEGGGVIAELIQDIFAAEGIEAELTFLPWARGYHETSLGEHDAMGVWMHKTEREAEFYYSDPVLVEQFVFFHLKETPFEWDALEDLTGYRMGGGIKYSYGPAFDAALAAGTFVMERQPNDRANFEKLLAGRVQLYPQEISVGYFALQNQFPPEKQARITHHPKAILNNESFVLFPKSLPESKELMARFNKRLQAFKDNGTYQLYLDRLGAKEAS